MQRLALCVALACFPACAQEILALRALGPHINDEAIKYIAVNAKPMQFTGVQFKDDRNSSPRAIIERLCGSLREPYYEEFMKLNDLKGLAPEVALGAKASELWWPACVFV